MTHGAFSWAELQTTDPVAAVEFYKNIFGWQSDVMPMEMGHYHVVMAGESGVGGIMARQSPDMPSCWASYVTVDDIHATSAKASELGGTVVVPVMDVPGVGILCGIMDPQGAVIMAIQYARPDHEVDPASVNIATFFKTHGAVSWVELQTSDMDGAIAFYSELFGWNIDVKPMDMGPYGIIMLGEYGIGGIASMAGPDVPPHWGNYVTVDDADEASAKAAAAGGTVIVPPMDIPEVGRFSVFQDPQGAAITAITYVAAMTDPS